jgi:O-antigen/teichoic acid export membrane protein
MSMSTESNISRIVKHAGFDTMGTVVSHVLLFVSSVVITRTIGAELFGKYALSNGIFLFCVVFAVFGLDMGVVRLTSKYNLRQDPAATKGTLLGGLGLTLSFSTIIMIAVLAMAPMIAARVFKNVEGIDWVLRVHILALPFYCLMVVTNGYTQGFKTLKYSVIVEAVSRPAIRLAAVVVLFLVGLRLSAVLFGTVISFAAASFLALHFAGKVSPFPFKRTRARRATREIFFFSLPLVLSRFTNIIISRANTILVGIFTDSTNTGLFGAAVSLSPMISLSLLSFSRIFSPFISELWEKRDLVELAATFKTVSKWVFSIGFPIALLFLLYAPSLLRIFGSDFQGASTTLRLLAAGQIVNAAVGPAGFVLSMTGRQKLNLVNSIILAGINVVLNVLMIPRWGIAGAGLATSLSLSFVNILRVVEIKLIHGFLPFRKDLIKPVAAGILTAAGFYLLNSFLGWEDIPRTLVLCAAFMVVYVVLLYAFGLREEKEILLGILRRRK